MKWYLGFFFNSETETKTETKTETETETGSIEYFTKDVD